MDTIRPLDVRPDPVVTEWANEYGTGGPFIADEVAPQIAVAARNFKFATYKADELNDEIETRVGPGGQPSEYRFQKPTFTASATERNVLDGNVSREVQLSLMNPLLGDQRRVRKLTHKLRVGVEKRVKTLFHAATNNGAAGTAWDNASATALGARKNIDDAAEALALRCGADAIHVAINIATARALARLASSYIVAGDPTMFVGGMFPQGLWGYTWHIAGALTNTGTAKADFSQTIARVWSDKEAYVFVADTEPTLESFGFVFQARWDEYATPYAGYTWPDPHQSKKVTWFSVENNQVELLVCDDACQRITGVLT